MAAASFWTAEKPPARLLRRRPLAEEGIDTTYQFMERLLQGSAPRPRLALAGKVAEAPFPGVVLLEGFVLLGERPGRGGHEVLRREVSQPRRGSQRPHLRFRTVALVLRHGAPPARSRSAPGTGDYSLIRPPP